MMVACKAVVVRAGTLLMIALGLSMCPAPAAAQQRARPAASEFPKACFFFKPGSFDYAGEKVIPEEERAYTEAARQVYRLWCTADTSTAQQRSDAADAMAVAWKRLWDRDMPYNAAFHERGQFDLLALLGVTHELPALMRTDPTFTSEWIKGCSNACFTISPNPDSQTNGHPTWLELGLRDDLLDNLKKEPAAEPVFKMLRNAKFTLVD
jgi:hypothetical protein